MCRRAAFGVRARINGSCHVCEWGMSHVWMSHVTHMEESLCLVLSHNASRETEYAKEPYKRDYFVQKRPIFLLGDNVSQKKQLLEYVPVVTHIWMSHVTCVHESCHMYAWVSSYVWRSHVARMDESCHTYEWVMSHIWLSHVIHINESCHTYKWVMSHI